MALRVGTAYMQGMPNVNPDILKWARETAGLTPEEAVKKLQLKDAYGSTAQQRLVAMEAGGESPSRSMLAKMAKRYRRPLLTFYLKEIPKKGDQGEDFRTLPISIDRSDVGLVDAVVRDICARQILVRAGLEEADEAESLPFIGSMRRESGVAAVVASIEQTLGFEPNAFRATAHPQSSFAYLRSCAEAAGIFVLLVDNLGSWHTTINVEAFRGFALADEVAPFVAVNANDSPGAWSFTLVHELAHLWIGATGVSGGIAQQTIEKFCNDVASEFLLPEDELAMLKINESIPLSSAKEQITDFAVARNIGKTMVAYRLHREGAISFERFQKLESNFRQAYKEWKAAKKEKRMHKGGGPTYYTVRMHRAGPSLISYVERMLRNRYLSPTKAGKVLGVGAHNVHALIAKSRSKRAI